MDLGVRMEKVDILMWIIINLHATVIFLNLYLIFTFC